MSEREFDVIVFGASGYTGKLVAEYMGKEYGNDESISGQLREGIKINYLL